MQIQNNIMTTPVRATTTSTSTPTNATSSSNNVTIIDNNGSVNNTPTRLFKMRRMEKLNEQQLMSLSQVRALLVTKINKILNLFCLVKN